MAGEAAEPTAVIDRDVVGAKAPVGEHQTVAADLRKDDATAQAISRKQQRIDMLEGLLLEFKDGLQQLLREKALRSEELKQVHLQRQRLADMAVAHAATITALTQRCAMLEQQTASGRERDKAVQDFGTRLVDGLKREEAACAAEARRVRQSREDAERFFETASGAAPATSAPEPSGSISERLKQR